MEVWGLLGVIVRRPHVAVGRRTSSDNLSSTFALQGRTKWQGEGDQFSVGQAVLIVDPQVPRALSHLGAAV